MERRVYPRVKTCNLISYLATRKNGEITDQGMGRALNISQSGIFLETPRLILSEYISLMSVDPDNNLIEIKGEVIYTGIGRSGMIGSGIHLQGERHENIQFATGLIKVFHIRKNMSGAGIPVQRYA